MPQLSSTIHLACSNCDAEYELEASTYPHAATTTLEITSCQTYKFIRHLDERKDFLCLPFDNKLSHGILRGDAIIVVQGKTDEPLHVHKFVLTSKSPVFSKMFDNKMLEEETGIVRIDDATLPVIRSVIKFCYDADINFTDEVTGEDVLAVAHKYDIALLRKICEGYLIATIDNGNLPKRLKLAKKFEVTRLEEVATTLFKHNFDTVISAVLAELC